MGEKVSHRTTGREVPGKMCKGPVIDAYNRLTQPSIPTKFSQILTIPRQSGGFNTSASRFREKINHTPGPGDYDEPPSINKSVSKKAYHMTQSTRFKKNQYKTHVPGPGSYESKSFKSSSAIVTGRGQDSRRTLDVPAPGYYDPKDLPTNKQISHVFRSKIERLPSAPNRSPAPWVYNPKQPSSSGSISRPFVKPSNFRREQINLYEPHATPQEFVTPGPGKYDNPQNVKTKPSSVFLATGVDRFGQPTRRRVAKFAPGPGEYSVERDSKKNLVTGAVFLSESKRGWLKVRGKPPGPAFYSPSPVYKRKSFHFQTAKVWV